MSNSAKTEFPETDNTKVSPRVESVRRFRANWRRIDYYPMSDAVAAIAWLRERNPKVTTRELIDALIIEGHQSLSGNSQD